MEEQSISIKKRRLRNFSIKNRLKIRKILKTACGEVCWYCGVIGKEFQIDHIVPICERGIDDITNLALVCKFCNSMKFGYDLSDFYEWQNHIRSNNFYRYYYPDQFHPLSNLYEKPKKPESTY